MHELYKYINKYYDQVGGRGPDIGVGEGEAGGTDVEGRVSARPCSRGLPRGLPAFQIITALEEDSTAQKMQLGYRLQQVAAAVENKVTDL